MEGLDDVFDKLDNASGSLKRDMRDIRVICWISERQGFYQCLKSLLKTLSLSDIKVLEIHVIQIYSFIPSSTAYSLQQLYVVV